MYRYFKVITNTDYMSSWKSKGLSDQSIKLPTTFDNSLTPKLNHYDAKIRVKFTGSCLKQPNITYNHGNVENIYIVYELGASSSHFDDSAIKNCLFGAVTLKKTLILINIDILDMELDLIEEEVFHFQMVDLVKM